MVTADTHALFAPLKPAAERGGERLGSNRSADPYCTDGNTVFRCDSDKNSLVVISMF